MSDSIRSGVSALSAAVKDYHRHLFWIVLACLFALDIVTTTVSLQAGNAERNPVMIPFAGNPVLHGLIKIGVFLLLFGVMEQAVRFIRERPPESQAFWIHVNYRTLESLILFFQVSLIGLYLFVLAVNIQEIAKCTTI